MRIYPLLFCAMLLLGCGGSGGGAGTARVARVDIVWMGRSRNVMGPASAESARVALDPSGASPEVSVVINRPSESGSDVTQTVELQGGIPSGPATLRVDFYSGADASGQVVGTANGSVQLAGGRTLGTVATVGNIESVEILGGQSLLVGARREIAIEARTRDGRIIALSPGSYRVRQSAGPGDVDEHGSSITGVARGVVHLVATVDGVSSPQQEVLVAPESKTYLIAPVGGSEGLTFINDISGDGTTAVGSSKSGSSPAVPIVWTRTGGTVSFAGLSVYGGANIATCVSRDGRVIAGANYDENGSESVPWVYTAATGTRQLALPRGLSNGKAVDISADGTVIVGTAFDSSGRPWCVRWIDGTPSTPFQGHCYCIAPDASGIGGDITLQDNRTVGFVWQSGGYFFQTISGSADLYLGSVRALNDGTTMAAGAMQDAPGFWSPGSGPVLVTGTITTKATSMSRDGQLVGISGDDPYLAMLFTRDTGLVQLGRYYDQVKNSGGPDLVAPFSQAGNGPAEVNGISEDRMSICGTAFPDPNGAVRGYVTDYSGFRQL
jgi:hypothetical protein